MEQSNENECDCQCGGQACECGTSQCCTQEYDKMDMMMYLAKTAKMDLIKEKIKKKLEAAHGKKLDKVADLLAEAMMECHKAEADNEKKHQEFRERLDAIFKEE